MATDDSLPEAKKHHLWRCTVWETDPDLHPLGPRHSAEVYCCEEANGFAVWYVRKLSHADARAGLGADAVDSDVQNGDYLLGYFAHDRRDDAITRAVLVATGAASPALQIAALDALAKTVQKV